MLILNYVLAASIWGVVTIGLQEGGKALGRRSGGKAVRIKYHVRN